MPSLFWTGKLTLPMKLLVEANNVLSLLTGSYRNIIKMKKRIKNGYEGEYTNHVKNYDEYGYSNQDRAAKIQLENINLNGMRVLDVGCGTGALAHVAFKNGAEQVICGDISNYMLRRAKQKKEYDKLSYTFCQLDAEILPYHNCSFDAVISGMAFGTFPNQKIAINEMARVARPGGLICIGAHGPEHYWEAIDASFRCINKRYIIGYRLEWWPRNEAFIKSLLEEVNLNNVKCKRIVWSNKFDNGASAYNFFAAISSSWWYAKFPPEERSKDSARARNYFERKNITTITDDIIIAYGTKPN